MSKGIILHLENRQDLRDEYKRLFYQSSLKDDFDYILCATRLDFEKEYELNKAYIRSVIFDLWGKYPEKRGLEEGNDKFITTIEESVAKYNIPIFIYSGYLDDIETKFDDYGTVYKIDKSDGIDVIFKKVKLFHDSGFLDLFCPGGFLDTQMHNEMHETFVSQFRHGEIENIINTVQQADANGCKERCTILFKRIAVQTLMSKLISPVIEEESAVNAAEHYYRRMNSIKFWTGDILEKNDKTEKVLILTPRCDCKKSTSHLICTVNNQFPKDLTKKGKEAILNALINNPQVTGYKLRPLPPCALFSGGSADISTYRLISITELEANYKVLISLSDGLTNEILAKFSAFFLRTGINTIDFKEEISYLEKLNEPK